MTTLCHRWLLRLGGLAAAAAAVCLGGMIGPGTALAAEGDAPAAPAAPTPTWKSMGPAGGLVNQVSWCAGAPGVVYAGTGHAGVYRSDDGGAHWAPARAGLPYTSVEALQASPGDCSVAYAATQDITLSAVSVTRDGGASWQDASAGLGGSPVSAFVLDPHDLSVVYAAAGSGLFRTRFGQTAWSTVWLTGQSPRVALVSAAVDPLASSILYAGLADTYDGNLGGLYKSTDGGRTWALANGNTQAFASLGGASNLLFDPAVPTTLYAIAGSGDFCGQLYKTTDGARTWTPIEIVGFPICALSASPAGTLFAVASAEPTTYVSRDHCATWKAASWGSGRDVRVSVAGTPGNPSRLLATDSSGLWASADDGLDWRPASVGLTAQRVWAVTAAANGTLYVQADNGPYRTSPRGRRWEVAHYNYLLALDPQRPETLYVANPPGTSFEYGRSTDGGATWSDFSYPDVDSYLLVDPTSSERLYSVSSPYDGNDFRCFVFKSLDTGVTWRCLADNDGFDELLVDPRHPTVLYGAGGGGPYVVERSDDGGNTFNRADQGLDSYVYALAIDPARPEVLYAATDHGLFRTTDQGRSWQLWSATLSGFTSQLIVDPRSPSRLYAGLPGLGVFGSFDGGLTWALLGQGLPAELFLGAFDLDRQLPATLYAGTNGEGVFRLDLEP